MSTPAVTTRPGIPIAEAARQSTRSRVRSMPVVDEAGRLVGAVSRADLIALFLDSEQDERPGPIAGHVRAGGGKSAR